jgi:hypothetical protein
VKSAKETTQLSWKTRPSRTTTRRRCRTTSSCGRGLAVLAYLTSLSFRINQLAWRLVCPRRRGSHAMWPGSVWLKS